MYLHWRREKKKKVMSVFVRFRRYINFFNALSHRGRLKTTHFFPPPALFVSNSNSLKFFTIFLTSKKRDIDAHEWTKKKKSICRIQIQRMCRLKKIY